MWKSPLLSASPHCHLEGLCKVGLFKCWAVFQTATIRRHSYTQGSTYTCTESLDLDLIVYHKPDECPAVCYQFFQKILFSKLLGRRSRYLMLRATSMSAKQNSFTSWYASPRLQVTDRCYLWYWRNSYLGEMWFGWVRLRTGNLFDVVVIFPHLDILVVLTIPGGP